MRAFEFLADCAQRPLQEVFHQHRPFSYFASPDSPWFRVALEGRHNLKGRSLEFSYQLKIGRSYESGPAIVEDESLVLGDYELRRESERFYAVPGIQVSPMQTLLHLMVNVSTDQLETLVHLRKICPIS
ncbi:hypothetical protein IV102_24295 [bacterium]|nr:hypothetical protein [bacterium]